MIDVDCIPEDPKFTSGGYLVPEDQMLAIAAILVHADEVCEAFDLGCQMSPDDFVDQVAAKVYDLRKALKELKALRDGE